MVSLIIKLNFLLNVVHTEIDSLVVYFGYFSVVYENLQVTRYIVLNTAVPCTNIFLCSSSKVM